MSNTTYQDILSSFQSLPQSKYPLPDSLVKQWFYDALGEYELEIHELPFDKSMDQFDVKLKQYQIKVIALLMYTYYLTRELSRAEKISGISGKDLTVTGGDESKRTIKADLELHLKRTRDLLDKQMQRCYG